MCVGEGGDCEMWLLDVGPMDWVGMIEDGGPCRQCLRLKVDMGSLGMFVLRRVSKRRGGAGKNLVCTGDWLGCLGVLEKNLLFEVKLFLG